MRKKYFTFLPLAAMLAFCGCSNEEEVIGNDANPGTTAKECGYIAVNIVQPADRGSKADNTGNFEDGIAAENKVNDATFFIYKNGSSDKPVTKQTIEFEKLTAGNGTTTEPNTEKIYSAVLSLNISKEELLYNYEGEIFCVLNAPQEIKDLGDVSRDNLLNTVNNYFEGNGINYTNEGTFIMSNSIYVKADASGNFTNKIYGSTFDNNFILDTSEAASKKPVEIYVERVVAKIKTSKAVSFNNDPFDNPLSDDADNKITVNITGLTIANIANKAYLFKNISDDNTWFESWHAVPTPTPSLVYDPNNKRCYWESVPLRNKGDYYDNLSYNDIVAGTENHTVDGQLVTDDPLDNWILTKYLLPNTSSTKTAILATAQLQDQNGAPITDLVWMMGKYMTSDDAKVIICNYLKNEKYAVQYSYTVDGVETKCYATIAPEQLYWTRKYDKSTSETKLEIPGLASYQAAAQVNPDLNNYMPKNDEGVKLIPDNATMIKREVIKYDFSNNKEINKETTTGVGTEPESYNIYDVNNELVSDDMKKCFADVFKDGLCYYFVEIDQSSVLGTNAGTNYGVVRNHIYDLSLDGVSGIGTAIFDPNAAIDPVRPNHDGFSYLSAKINVLSWRLVKQNVSFNGQ